MNKGDIIYMNTLTSQRLDIKILKENLKALTTPHHINFISVDGIYEFFSSKGFEEVKINTLGKIDLDIKKKHKMHKKEGSLLDVINSFSDKDIDKLQKLISKNKMSSHIQITARL